MELPQGEGPASGGALLTTKEVFPKSDCLFCKIAARAIPSRTHFLVIPKEHIGSVAEVNEANAAVAAHIFTVIARQCKKLGLDSYRVVSNIGEQAGQSVPHLHFHVLAGRDMTWPPG